MSLIVNGTEIENVIVIKRDSGVSTTIELLQDSNGVEIWSGFKKYGQLIDRSITSVVAEDLDGATTIGKYAFANCVNLSSVVLPNSITTIGDYAFYNDTYLDVALPSALTSIGSYAFGGCNISGELTLPSTLTSIGSYAFDANNISGTLTIPNGVTSVPIGSFSRNKITTAIIPASVTSMDIGAFITGQVGGTIYLSTLRMLGTTPPTLTTGGTVPVKFPTSVKIQVPSSSLSAYQSADQWSKYVNQMVGV